MREENLYADEEINKKVKKTVGVITEVYGGNIQAFLRDVYESQKCQIDAEPITRRNTSDDKRGVPILRVDAVATKIIPIRDDSGINRFSIKRTPEFEVQR